MGALSILPRIDSSDFHFDSGHQKPVVDSAPQRGADRQWRKNPPMQILVGMVAIERLGWATGRVEASGQKSAIGWASNSAGRNASEA
jgi:hypothetical protein